MRARTGSRLLLAAAMAGWAGCAHIPKDALQLAPDSLEKRQLQTRRFEGISEVDLVAASAGVLQDVGFNIDESESRLGLLVASKRRSAVETGQVIAAFLGALVGAEPTYDRSQVIRVCLVVRPASGEEGAKSHLVRVTIQRIIWNNHNQVSRAEAVEEPEIYQQFFQKLSESVFLEAQKI